MKLKFYTRSIVLATLLLTVFVACGDKKQSLTAQQIVDRAITVAGGDLYNQSEFSFRFRDIDYRLERQTGRKVLSRIRKTDSGEVRDVWDGNSFERYVDGEIAKVSDSMANVYANSINSVHYFAYLPYGLNDLAVNKLLIGEKEIGGRSYLKIKVTFDEEGGGDDFEDVFVYWIDKETFKPTYLAYEFQVNEGGQRFREAYNERYINGIRFVDYHNYKPKVTVDIARLDSLFEIGKLELLSEIKLEKIKVSRDNYN